MPCLELALFVVVLLAVADCGSCKALPLLESFPLPLLVEAQRIGDDTIASSTHALAQLAIIPGNLPTESQLLSLAPSITGSVIELGAQAALSAAHSISVSQKLESLKRRRKNRVGGPKLKCLFIHGAGQKFDKVDTVPTYEAYWGKSYESSIIKKCDSKFLQYESTDKAWDDPDIHEKICAKVLEIKPNVVIAHSMGNLHWASIRLKKTADVAKSCASLAHATGSSDKDPSHIHWIAIAGPFLGSKAAELCYNVCTTNSIAWEFPAHASHGCACTKTTPPKLSVSMQSLRPNYSAGHELSFKLLAAEAIKASAVVCGTSWRATTAFNLDWLGMPLLEFVEKLYNHKIWGDDSVPKDPPAPAGNDAMVAFTSCRGENPPANFEATYKSKYYAGKFNHGSAMGRDGDGTTNDTKPLAFIDQNLSDIATTVGATYA